MSFSSLASCEPYSSGKNSFNPNSGAAAGSTNSVAEPTAPSISPLDTRANHGSLMPPMGHVRGNCSKYSTVINGRVQRRNDLNGCSMDSRPTRPALNGVSAAVRLPQECTKLNATGNSLPQGRFVKPDAFTERCNNLDKVHSKRSPHRSNITYIALSRQGSFEDDEYNVS